MSRQNLEQVREKLKRRLKELIENSPKTRDLITERSTDPVDEVQSEVSVALKVCAINIDWKTTKAIKAALDRIETGGYGICDACGEAISPKRLQAIPWANLCVRCQLVQEAAENSIYVYSEVA